MFQPVMPGTYALCGPAGGSQWEKSRSTKLQMGKCLQLAFARRKRAGRTELWEFSVWQKAESSDNLFI